MVKVDEILQAQLMPLASPSYPGGPILAADRPTSSERDARATRRERVVIVGAGFGGLAAACALRKAPVDVTVIDRRNYHLFQPLLYQVATAGLSPAEIATPIRSILRDQQNTRVLLGRVGAIDKQARTVEVEGRSVRRQAFARCGPGRQAARRPCRTRDRGAGPAKNRAAALPLPQLRQSRHHRPQGRSGGFRPHPPQWPSRLAALGRRPRAVLDRISQPYRRAARLALGLCHVSARARLITSEKS